MTKYMIINRIQRVWKASAGSKVEKSLMWIENVSFVIVFLVILFNFFFFYN